jgi:type VI secretion system protein ImpL
MSASPPGGLDEHAGLAGKNGQKGEALADSIVDSAKKLVGRKNMPDSSLSRQGRKVRWMDVFGPLTGLMEGKEGTGTNGNLSFQSWLARVTQVRLKLQQVTSAPDPQAMSQMLAQTVFQGKAIDLTDTRDYSSLVAASLGQEWNGFGQSLFVQPLDLAWRRYLLRLQEASIPAGRQPLSISGTRPLPVGTRLKPPAAMPPCRYWLSSCAATRVESLPS